MNSKVVNLANTKEEYIQLVNKALLNPGSYTNNSDTCLKEIITYTDGRSTDRAVDAIKTFFCG